MYDGIWVCCTVIEEMIATLFGKLHWICLFTGDSTQADEDGVVYGLCIEQEGSANLLDLLETSCI